MNQCPIHKSVGGACESESCGHRKPHEPQLGCVSGRIKTGRMDIIVKCCCREEGSCVEVEGEELSMEKSYGLKIITIAEGL